MSGLGGSVHVVPPMNFGPGYLAPISARVRKAVTAAVFVAGRINDVREAENVLARGEADMCGMTRAQICDPAMSAKVMAGALDDIRACIGCNQACIGHFHAGDDPFRRPVNRVFVRDQCRPGDILRNLGNDLPAISHPHVPC